MDSRPGGGLCVGVAAACRDLGNPYAAKWKGVAIGDSRESVMTKLGRPTRVSAMAVPLESAEWAIREAPRGRRYTAYFGMDHVVPKATASR